MRTIKIPILLALALALVGCGSGSNSINGHWTAALTNSGTAGSPAFAFTATLTKTGGTTVSVTNLNFTTASACFPSGSTATGGFAVSGTMNGVTSGSFQMNIQSAAAGTGGNNLLTLQGTLNNNSITGTWTLTGVTAGCSGSGSFTMTKT